MQEKRNERQERKDGVSRKFARRRSETLAKTFAATQQLVDQQRADLRSASARVQGLGAALAQLRAPMGRNSEIKAQQQLVESLRAAVEDTEGNFCTACYTGSYPTELVQLEVEAHREG